MVPQQDELTPSDRPDTTDDRSLAGESIVGLELHRGPLPHVRDFAAYEKTFPGAAHRILKMAERDQKAYIRIQWANWLASFVAMILGKSFLYFLVVAAVYLAVNDKPLEAFLAGLAPIVAAIYANTRKDEPAEGPEEEE